MPVYEPEHVEYSINSGMIHIAMDDGRQLPAYWAYPTLGARFPGVALVHDWWGLTSMMRRIANLFAQMGHYVIVPDLYDGRIARTAHDAMIYLEETNSHNYKRVDDALSVLENHNHCNKSVAAVGVGLGGSLAFEAAIHRDDLEAAVAFSGFPHRYLGHFVTANTPICAFFGSEEPHIAGAIIKRMRDELIHSQHNLAHEIHIIQDIGHEFFSETLTQAQRENSRHVLKYTLDFLGKHLERANHAGDRSRY